MAQKPTSDIFSWINDEINPDNKIDSKSTSNGENNENKPTINDLIENKYNNNMNNILLNNNNTPFNIETSNGLNYLFQDKQKDIDNKQNDKEQTFTEPMDLNYLFSVNNDKDRDMIAESDDDDIDDEKTKNNIKSTTKNNIKSTTKNDIKLSNKDGFDANLFKTILNEYGLNKNIIFSSFNILSSMTICLCGANGNTLNEMLSVLYPNINNKINAKLLSEINNKHLISKYCGISTDYPLIKIANKLWICKGYKILDSFKKIIDEKQINTMDVNKPMITSQIINKWCSISTNNKIQNIISPQFITPSTKLIISNAIYFKAKFLKPFNKKDTEYNISFYKNKDRFNKISKVTMMYSNKYRVFKQKVNGIYDIVELKYKNSKLSLICVINNYSIRNKKQLLMNDILNVINNTNPKELRLFLPKFKYDFKMELNSILQIMGINDAFIDDIADFSGINGSKQLKISKVVHGAIIEIDEDGTEAAAATVISCVSGGCYLEKKQPPTIRFDHPFIFYIYDHENHITLFEGRFVGK